MEKSGMSDVSSEDPLVQQLDYFRRGVLCSAALHTQSSSHPSQSGEVQGCTSGEIGHSLLDFRVWDEYPQLLNGVFSLQEFLGVACNSGAGLPFGASHTQARAGRFDSEYSYSKFKYKLQRIRGMFRVDDVERLEKFATCHLEWLAVFLSILDWRPKTFSAETTDRDDARPASAPFNSTCIARDNLRSQLGVAQFSSASSPFFSDFLSSFPLCKTTVHRTARRNRYLLELGLHIGNMLALSAAVQHNFMSTRKEWNASPISNAFESVGISHKNDLYSARESETTTSIKVDSSSEREQEIFPQTEERRGEIGTSGSFLSRSRSLIIPVGVRRPGDRSPRANSLFSRGWHGMLTKLSGCMGTKQARRSGFCVVSITGQI